MKIFAIVWLAIIGLCFVAVWIVYFVHYPL